VSESASEAMMMENLSALLS